MFVGKLNQQFISFANIPCSRNLDSNLIYKLLNQTKFSKLLPL